MTHLHDPLLDHRRSQTEADHRREVNYILSTSVLEVQDIWLELSIADLDGGRSLSIASPRFFAVPKALAPESLALTSLVGSPKVNLRLAVTGLPTNFMAGSASVT